VTATRSEYEFGEEPLDVERARRRGEQCQTVADAVVSALVARGFPGFEPDDARVIVFSVLADALFGGLPVDVPTLRG
jgi:hypothetical protein